jgi:anti-anti-sigma factor
MSGGYLIEVDEAAATVVAHGELDLAAVDDLRAGLRRAVRDGRVVLDLEPVTFLDSSAAGVILDLLVEGTIPTLRAPGLMPARVLRLLGLGAYVLARPFPDSP